MNDHFAQKLYNYNLELEANQEPFSYPHSWTLCEIPVIIAELSFSHIASPMQDATVWAMRNVIR